MAAVRFLDSDHEFLSRYRAPGAAEPFHVLAAFGFGWDALDRKTGQPYAADPVKFPETEHFHVIAQRQSNAQRQVIASNEQDFFEDFERTHGAWLTRATDWLLAASDAQEEALAGVFGHLMDYFASWSDGSAPFIWTPGPPLAPPLRTA